MVIGVENPGTLPRELNHEQMPAMAAGDSIRRGMGTTSSSCWGNRSEAELTRHTEAAYAWRKETDRVHQFRRQQRCAA